MTDWIEWKWTPENPYPETLETSVWIRLDDDFTDEKMSPWRVKDWYWNANGEGVITHYKVAKP